LIASGISCGKRSWHFASPGAQADETDACRKINPTDGFTRPGFVRTTKERTKQYLEAFFEFRAMIAFTLFKTDWLPDEVYIKSNCAKD
jgi:hypothetical protein